MGDLEPLSGVAVRLPKADIDVITEILRAQWERAGRTGTPTSINFSEVLRHVFRLGLYQFKMDNFVRWMTAPRPLFTVQEAADKVRLPEELLRKEASQRRILLPPAAGAEAKWPAGTWPASQPATPEAPADVQRPTDVRSLPPEQQEAFRRSIHG